MIDFVCWKWQSTGWRAPYTTLHVNALYRMLEQHVSGPWRLHCITDRVNEKGMNEAVNVVPLPKDKKLRVATTPSQPNCFVRLKLFDKETSWDSTASRIVSIDLDCIVLRDLAPLFTDDPFKIVKGRVTPYNGSMWQLAQGAHPEVYDTFDPLRSPAIIKKQRHAPTGHAYYGSDQGWISYIVKDAPTWDVADGVHQISSTAPKDDAEARILFFPGGLKPWSKEMKHRNRPLYERYMQYTGV